MASKEASEGRDVTEVDAGVLRDLGSKYMGVACPIHNVPPKFEVDEAGGVVEAFCCETLLKIVRELQANEAASGEATATEGE